MALSYLQTQFLELLQSLRVAPRIIHGIVGVRGDAIFLPLRRLGRVLDHAGVKITDSAAGETEWVASKEAMEIIIDELPVERDVVRDKNRATLGVLLQPCRKMFHHDFRFSKTQMLFAGEAADGQSLRDKAVRDRACPAVKGLVEKVVENHSTEAHHGKLCGNRPIRFNIDDNVVHRDLFAPPRYRFAIGSNSKYAKLLPLL